MADDKKQLRILFVDDNPYRHETFRMRAKWLYPRAVVCHAMKVEEAIEMLKNEEPYDVLSCDHDMDLTSGLKEPKTCDPAEWRNFWYEKESEDGIALARFIRDELPAEKLPAMVVIHSVNRQGSIRMIRTIKQRMPEVYGLPFDRQRSFWGG